MAEKRDTILTYVHVALLVIGFVGMMLLFSDAAIDGQGEVTLYFNLILSMIFYTLSVGATDFIAAQYTGGLRMVGLFLFFVFVESSACRIDYYLNLDGGVDSDETHRNTVRVGAIMVVVTSIATFAVNHLIPHKSPVVPAGFVTIRNIAAIITALTAIAAQIIIYFINDGCYIPIPHKFVRVADPGIFAIVTLTSHVYGDFAMQDFSFAIAIYWLVAAAPIFADETHPTEENYPEMWRATVALLFAGAALYILATIVHTCIYRKQADTKEERKASHKKLAIIVQILLLLVAIGGAVTVYIRITDDIPYSFERNLLIYFVSGLLLCPIGNLLREITDIEGLHIVMFALSFHLLGATFFYLHNYPGILIGYVRGGLVFEVCAVIASMLWVPFVRAKERPVWHLFERVPVWGAFLFGVWGIATAYTWGAVTLVPLGAQVFYRVWPIVLLIWLVSTLARHRVDEERVMFFIALHIGLSGYVWLINEVQQQTFDYFTLFIACTTLVLYYLMTGPGSEPFPFIHHMHAVKPVTPAGRHEPHDVQPRHVEPYPHDGQAPAVVAHQPVHRLADE